VRSYWSRSAAPIIVPAAPKGRLPLKSSCRMWNRYVPKHKRQRGVASVVPGRATHNRKGGRGAEQNRTLRPLAGSPLGCTQAIMLAYGFTVEMLGRLVLDGLATATPRGRASRRAAGQGDLVADH
jgi:hypothetical protein